jgi:5-methylcytosine-specific restriction endonuclease McrA
VNKKARESKELAQVAKKLIYLSGEKFTSGIGIYAQAIKEAMKAVGANSYSGNPRAFIKQHLEQLNAYCTANSKKITEIKRARQKEVEVRRIARWQKQSTPAKAFVATDDFLTTFEWRKLRMEALIKYGRRCVCCGATPMTGATMNVDHIKPRKLFPELALDINNLQILCHECNHGKGNWDQTDWR